jgi:hypothetical protein
MDAMMSSRVLEPLRAVPSFLFCGSFEVIARGERGVEALRDVNGGILIHGAIQTPSNRAHVAAIAATSELGLFAVIQLHPTS